MDFSKISNSLILRDGIWFSKDQHQISYPETGNSDCFQVEDKSFWFQYRNKCIQFLVNKYSPNQLFFDVGGGNGFVSSQLSKSGVCEVALLEPGINGVLNAQKRGLTNLICASVQDGDFQENTFPAVGMFDVLEHIEHDSLFLKHINNLLKKEGHLFITVPAYNFLWSQDDVLAGHHRRYTLKNLESLLDKNNFDIVFSSYFFMFLVLPIFLFRTIPDFFRKNKKEAEISLNDHSPSLGKKLIDCILSIEYYFFSKNIRLPFGGSCIVVAKKRQK